MQIFGNDKSLPIHTIVTQKDGIYSVGPLDGKVEYRYAYSFLLLLKYPIFIISFDQRHCRKGRFRDNRTRFQRSIFSSQVG